MNREKSEEASARLASDDESDSSGVLDHEEVTEDDLDGPLPEDGSDTARIAQSVTKYARRCVQTGAFAKAMVALQSAVEIAEMPSLAYRRSVFQTAQVLRAAHEFEASISCMQTIYRHMPTPYTHVAGFLIISRLYENLQRLDCAQFWRKKLGDSINRNNDQLRRLWHALGEQAFEQQDFVFAADFYTQWLASESGNGGREADTRTTYRYLFSLTQFTGPCDAIHRQQRQFVAWQLVQRFLYDRSQYGDPNYWALRELYARCFPEIYRAVFEWDEVFARQIARWWESRYSSSADANADEKDTIPAPFTTGHDSVHPTPPRTEDATPKKAKRRRQRVTKTPSVASVEKLTSRPRLSRRTLSKRSFISQRIVSDSKLATKSPNNSEACDTNDATESHNNSCVSQTPSPRIGTSKATPDNYEASPTKRKLGAVRRLRKQRLSDDVRPPRPIPATSAESMPGNTALCPETLLELYPLRAPLDEAFVHAVGRKPGLAELDVHQLEEFARIAHYRARLIGAKHAEVSALDPERVKPRWLADFERAVDFLSGFQRSRQRLEDDSIAHISEIHARLVFQLTAIHRQYTDEFGTSSFTLGLQSVTHQLAKWKFQRIAELTQALEAAKRMGVDEEKRRSLEFYHIHR